MLVGNAVGLPRAVLHVVTTVVLVLVAQLGVSLLAYLVAGPAGSVATFVVVQSAAGLLLLLVLVRWRAAVGLRAGLPATPWTGLPVVLSYGLLPAAWAARALFGWQLVGPGVLALGFDLVLWGAAVGLGVLWATSQVELREAPLTPYG